MKSEEFSFINQIFDVINNKIPNSELQDYIRTHLTELLNYNDKINDLSTGIEIYKENNNKIAKYFKLIFHPKNNDFNIENFDKISIVYMVGDEKSEKKDIYFSGNLIEVDEIDSNTTTSPSKNSFVTIQNTFKKKYLKNKLVYNFRLLSKISSAIFIPSYSLEEETFINEETSSTKSDIKVLKYCDEKIIKEDIKKTDTFLAKYIDCWDELNETVYMNSNYLAGEQFSDKSKNDFIPGDIIVSPISIDAYQKVEHKYNLKKVA